MRWHFVKSRWFIFLGTTTLLLFLFFLGREVYSKYQIRQEIGGLKSEITRLENQNQELTGFLEYFKTTAYKERQARSFLNLKKPGEFAVALPVEQENEETSVAREQAQKSESSIERWKNYFFHKSDANP